MAGDRTRIDRLEGDHADHYTTNADNFIESIKYIFVNKYVGSSLMNTSERR